MERVAVTMMLPKVIVKRIKILAAEKELKIWEQYAKLLAKGLEVDD